MTSMKLYIPASINLNIRKKLGYVKIEKIKVKVETHSIKDECLNNVLEYLQTEQGEIQFGWKFSILGNVIIRAIGHAVLKNNIGTLICITPNDLNLNEINFLPDNSIKSRIVNNYLPCKHVSLIDNNQVKACALAMDEYENLKINDPSDLYAEKRQLSLQHIQPYYESVLAQALLNTKMDDCCYCGSGILRAFCHQ